jgi:hypothetical protein
MAREEPGRYRPAEIEAKWQAEWEKRGTNRFTEAELRSPEAPYYNLMMFPYPSAEGLHVGNIYAFTGADVYGRYMRLRGHTATTKASRITPARRGCCKKASSGTWVKIVQGVTLLLCMAMVLS